MGQVLIAGGAGFIGSHLCKKLLNEGKSIVCVDNLFTGSKSNIEEFLANERFTFIKHDITEPLYLEYIDEIYNLACPASPVHYQYDPIHTIRTSSFGGYYLLELAKKNNAKILQASTSEVYGDPEVHPQTESYRGCVNTMGIRACYDEGKRLVETMFFEYHRMHQLQTKVIRIFNTYGPFMNKDDGRVVSNFIVQALENKDITIYGDGSQTRSFCYVDDLINGMVAMMNSQDDFIGPVNLGNPEEYTVKQLAEKIIEMTNSKSKIIYMPLPKDDPVKRKPDISLAKEKLAWMPNIPLEQGLERTIDYFKKVINYDE